MKRENMNKARNLVERIEKCERLRHMADEDVRVYVGKSGSGDTSVTLSKGFAEVLKANIKSTLSMHIIRLTAELEEL